MSEGRHREGIGKSEAEDDSIRITGIIKPLASGDNIEEYNENKLNAKREKFKMEWQGPTLKVG